MHGALLYGVHSALLHIVHQTLCSSFSLHILHHEANPAILQGSHSAILHWVQSIPHYSMDFFEKVVLHIPPPTICITPWSPSNNNLRSPFSIIQEAHPTLLHGFVEKSVLLIPSQTICITQWSPSNNSLRRPSNIIPRSASCNNPCIPSNITPWTFSTHLQSFSLLQGVHPTLLHEVHPLRR